MFKLAYQTAFRLSVTLTAWVTMTLAAFIPVQVQATPLALALLNPAVVGSVVVAGGVMAGAAAHYAPAVYEAGQVAVDSLGTFSRTLYQVQKFAVSSGVDYLIGRSEQVALSLGQAGSSVYDWVRAHVTDIPSLSTALSDSESITLPPSTGTVPSLGVGDVVTVIQGDAGGHELDIGTVKQVLVGAALYTDRGCVPPSASNFGIYYYYGYAVRVRVNGGDCGGGNVQHLEWEWFSTSTTLMDTYDDVVFSPVAFETAVNALDPSVVATEVDKIISALPSAVTGVQPWTASESQIAASLALAAAAQDALSTAEDALAADPTNTALQIARDQAAADAASQVIAAQGETAAVEDSAIPPSVPSPSSPLFPAIPAVQTLDFFGPIHDQLDSLSSALSTHEPFATFSSLPGMLTALTATPQAPVIDVTLPVVGNFHIDLAPWDPVAIMVRSGLSFLTVIGLSYFVLRVWL